MKLIYFLQIAGVLHLGLFCAGAAMPRAVKLQAHLATLPAFIRRLFYVYFSFVGLMLVGFGVISFLCASALAEGDPLARAVCVFLALFWIVRLFVAGFVFDVRPYLTHWFYRLGYWATNIVFVYLAAVYAWTAWRGGVS